MGRKHSKFILGFFKYGVLLSFLVIVMSPFFRILVTSLKNSQAEVYAFPVRYLPQKPSLVNYTSMLWKGSFGRYMNNSLLVPAVTATFASMIGIGVDYILSRFKFRLKSPLLLFYLITQMVPMFMMLPSLCQMLPKRHMLNNIWVIALLHTNMMIPSSVATLRGFFDGIPSALEEAVWIDGCSYSAALRKTIIPIIKPGTAAASIFVFINSWNELFMIIMFTDKDKYRAILVGLNALVLEYDIRRGEMTAGTVMVLIPTILLFSVAQKCTVEGLTAGSVEGQVCLETGGYIN